VPHVEHCEQLVLLQPHALQQLKQLVVEQVVLHEVVLHEVVLHDVPVQPVVVLQPVAWQPVVPQATTLPPAPSPPPSPPVTVVAQAGPNTPAAPARASTRSSLGSMRAAIAGRGPTASRPPRAAFSCASRSPLWHRDQGPRRRSTRRVDAQRERLRHACDRRS
jgi:hypothetical protein